MTFSLMMQAPASWTGGSVRNAPSGNTYVPDAYGFVTVTAIPDVSAFLSLGFRIVTERSNYTYTRDPTLTDDNTADFSAGSAWVNISNGVVWRCISAGTGAAVWVPLNASSTLIGRLFSANMNTTADQPLVMLVNPTAVFRLSKVTVTNASVSLTTAAGGIYSAANKGGTALVAAGQVYSALTGSTGALDLTMATNLRLAAGTGLHLALTTAQGATATADVFAYGDILS